MCVFDNNDPARSVIPPNKGLFLDYIRRFEYEELLRQFSTTLFFTTSDSLLSSLLNCLQWVRDAFLQVTSSVSPCFVDDDSDDGLDGRSLSSTSTKRSRYLSGNGGADNLNDEYVASQGKCSVCGVDSPPTYYCIKCRMLFHAHCDNFRIENGTTGICGSCLTSVPFFHFGDY